MVSVNIGYNPYVKNTGATHDLIVGCSVFTDLGDNFVVDLFWFVLYDMPSGASWQPVFDGYLYTGITGINAGNYMAKCRAWKSYNLTGATKLYDISDPDGNIVGAMYREGAVYGDSPGDGNYLDQISRAFTITEEVADVSMDLTFLDIDVV